MPKNKNRLRRLLLVRNIIDADKIININFFLQENGSFLKKSRAKLQQNPKYHNHLPKKKIFNAGAGFRAIFFRLRHHLNLKKYVFSDKNHRFQNN